MFTVDKSILSFFLLLIIFSFLNNIKSNIIVFPFKTEPSNPRISNYIDSFTKNQIYITVNIGSPSQNINLYLTMSTNYLIIANSSIDPSYYNSKQSSTYESISSYSDYLTEYLDKGYFAKESFIFKTGFDENDKKKFDNVEFALITGFGMANQKAPGYFGLQLPKKNKQNIYNCLKRENIIDEYYWNIKYTSDLEGYFILGGYPPDYGEEKFIKTSNALPCDEGDANLCWNLRFNDIKFGEIDVNRDRTAEIRPELGFIVGTGEYKQKISDNFFDKLGDKCKKEYSDTSYEYFVCKENTDLSNFINLEFVHPDFNYKFIMTKDDLFKKYGEEIYFQIIFDKYSPQGTHWKLGKPFLKKYNFGFNTDSKKIYFYNEDKEHSEGYLVYYIVIGVLIIGIMGMITFVVVNKIIKPKRKKANELTDEINFSNNNNANSNENENNDNVNQNFLGV